jgi:hypothetical protein
LKKSNLQQQIDVKSDGRASEEYAEVRVGSLYTSLATEPPGGHVPEAGPRLIDSAASIVSTAKQCSGEWPPEDPTLLSIHKVPSMTAARLFEGTPHRLLEGAESFGKSRFRLPEWWARKLSVSCTGETGETSRLVALETGKQSILHSGWLWLIEGTKSRESMQCR